MHERNVESRRFPETIGSRRHLRQKPSSVLSNFLQSAILFSRGTCQSRSEAAPLENPILADQGNSPVSHFISPIPPAATERLCEMHRTLEVVPKASLAAHT